MSCEDNCKCILCIGVTTPEKLDDYLVSMVKKKGWIIIPVINPKDPDFIPIHYTMGLTETFKSPEIVIIGHFSTSLINDIIVKIVDQIKVDCKVLDGEELENISQIEFEGKMKWVNYGCRVAEDEFRESFCEKLVNRHGKEGFQLRQVILPNKKGKLPWHTGYDMMWARKAKQICLYDRSFHINPIKECHGCYVRDQKFLKCSGCLTILYCGEACQKADWKKHKPNCKK